MSIFQENF